MSAGHLSNDTGFVWGNTWSNSPNYTRLGRPVTLEEARQTLDIPYEKRRLHVRMPGQKRGLVPVEAFAIVRADDSTIVWPSVGNKYTLVDNLHLLQIIKDNYLGPETGLSIESVGTLWGGGIAFVNVCLDRFHVKNDPSETVTRLMYYNPIGRGSIKVCCHDVRSLCSNALNMKLRQGALSETLLKICHTANASVRVEDHLAHIAELQLGVLEHHKTLNALAEAQVSEKLIKVFLGHMIPMGTDATDRKENNVIADRNAVRSLFESDVQDLGGSAKTRYGLLQSFTYWKEHGQDPNSRADRGTQIWDNLVGGAARSKEAALEFLSDADYWLAGPTGLQKAGA